MAKKPQECSYGLGSSLLCFTEVDIDENSTRPPILRFCMPEVITNWRVGRPGNKAT